MHVETHNRIRRIGRYAFNLCKLLQRIDIKSVVEIDKHGFYGCEKLHFVEFGDKLEAIGTYAFYKCAIEHLKLPSIVSIGNDVFLSCTRLIDVEFSEKLERVSSGAFYYCERLQRIAFQVHQTITKLHMKSWREEMKTEINRINLLLPDTASIDKTGTIIEWMDSVIDKLDHYKAEHCSYVKEAATLLELALWKVKLDEREDTHCQERATKKAKVKSKDDARLESRVTCGADTVIKNVLPYLRLE